jgi:hypothetical protein
VLGPQAHFFMQFAKHRLLGRLTVLDAALRELPRVGAQPLAPEDLVARVEQDDADVGPEAFPVEHNQTPISDWFHYCTGCAARELSVTRMGSHNPASASAPRSASHAGMVKPRRAPMKASQFFISTLKEAPADAEVVSHQLMMRAGMIKRLGAASTTTCRWACG